MTSWPLRYERQSDPHEGLGPPELVWLTLSSDHRQGLIQGETQSASRVCISEKVSTDRTETLWPCLKLKCLEGEDKLKQVLAPERQQPLWLCICPFMGQYADLAPLHLPGTVLILRSTRKNTIQLWSQQMQTSNNMCKCKGMIRLFIVRIA